MSREIKERNRREFLGEVLKTTAGAAAIVTTGAGTVMAAGAPVERAEPGQARGGGTAGLLEGLSFSEPFSGNWWLREVHGPIAGGLILLISYGRDGKLIRLDVCRRGDRVKAPAFTKHLEVFVMDGGGGVKDLSLEFIEAVGDLASVIEDNEDNRALLEGLLTHSERLEQHHDFMMCAARVLRPTL